MARPVVHFEVIGRHPDQLRRYYGDLFGWTFETPSPVAREVSDADRYGFVELMTADDGSGIRGGIGGGEGYDSHAVFYVGVQDVEAALARAKAWAALGCWVRSHHQVGSWLAISRTPRAL